MPAIEKETGFDKFCETVEETGPNRIVVNKEGYATNQRRARECFGIDTPDVIFIRYDGWCLGAPLKFEDIAFKSWEGDWLGMIKNGERFLL
jgi:hypothetical protein